MQKLIRFAVTVLSFNLLLAQLIQQANAQSKRGVCEYSGEETHYRWVKRNCVYRSKNGKQTISFGRTTLRLSGDFFKGNSITVNGTTWVRNEELKRCFFIPYDEKNSEFCFLY